ncbi:MAG: hypothetical protein IH898_04080, partial [Planctomycetes bacterium]|nr:hypothetical protein [Planctomycetota bacterium]
MRQNIEDAKCEAQKEVDKVFAPAIKQIPTGTKFVRYVAEGRHKNKTLKFDGLVNEKGAVQALVECPVSG